jgi:REP element-mobilizing transposase RayT
MPLPGKRWLHVIINTHCSWLPGDPRGFRNRKHRIHSSGNYRNPPPPDEHAGLYQYNLERSAKAVCIPHALRSIVGTTIVQLLSDLGHRILAISVSGMHTHMLVELPRDPGEQRLVIGQCKNRSSRAIKRQLPGCVWARAGTFKPIKDRNHHRRAFRYILDQQGEGAWTWSYREKPIGADRSAEVLT